MQFVIITGISGSGKSLALRIFEDMGFYCVDNMPPALIPQLAALCRDSQQPSGDVPRKSVVGRRPGPRSTPSPGRCPPSGGGDGAPETEGDPVHTDLYGRRGAAVAQTIAGLAAPPSETEDRCSASDDSASAAAGEARIACVTDVRAGAHLAELEPALRELEQRGVTPLVLFLDASDSVLVNRFKETRRKHPLLVAGGGIMASIAAEREMLKELKERADKVIDTSDYNPRVLTGLLSELFGTNGDHEGLMINITSFGFKHGLPLDADLVFDVRFLANPHYVRELRWQDGRDEAVRSYVMQDPLTRPFLEKLFDLIDFTLPQYVAEGKAYLTIAIGCTGGRHRSVMVAEELARFLHEKGYPPHVHHRDAKK